MDATTRLAVAREAAETGAEVAMEGFRGEFTVDSKASALDSVTEFDREVQRRIATLLREEEPDAAIVGEETLPDIDTRTTVPDQGTAWVIDPIDGTNNYVRDARLWGTAVAAVRDGTPVAGATEMPALGDGYWTDGEDAYRNGDPVTVSDRDDPEACAVTPTMWWDFDARERYDRACGAIVERFGDLRRMGCAQAELAGVAEGSLDGVVTDVRAHPWDTLAGVAMVRAAGGTVTDLDGEPWRYDSVGLVASNGQIHATLLDAAREIRDGGA